MITLLDFTLKYVQGPLLHEYAPTVIHWDAQSPPRIVVHTLSAGLQPLLDRVNGKIKLPTTFLKKLAQCDDLILLEDCRRCDRHPEKACRVYRYKRAEQHPLWPQEPTSARQEHPRDGGGALHCWSVVAPASDEHPGDGSSSCPLKRLSGEPMGIGIISSSDIPLANTVTPPRETILAKTDVESIPVDATLPNPVPASSYESSLGISSGTLAEQNLYLSEAKETPASCARDGDLHFQSSQRDQEIVVQANSLIDVHNCIVPVVRVCAKREAYDDLSGGVPTARTKTSVPEELALASTHLSASDLSILWGMDMHELDARFSCSVSLHGEIALLSTGTRTAAVSGSGMVPALGGPVDEHNSREHTDAEASDRDEVDELEEDDEESTLIAGTYSANAESLW